MASKETNFFHDIVPDPSSAKSSLLKGNKEMPGFLKRKARLEFPPERFLPRQPPRRFKFLLLLGAALIALAALLLLVSFFFKKATAEVVAKELEVQINTNFTASRGAPLADKLTFQTKTFKVTVQKVLPSAGSRQVERKSTGTIVVYNNYSREGFRLRKDTRFETADGKIYRTPISIVVPGIKTVSGKSVPGSVEVTVAAEKPGAQYDIGLVDFTLPGLKESPDFFKNVYARAKTPMSGGFAGNVKVVDPLVLEEARGELEVRLKAELAKLAGDEITGDDFFFEEGSFFTSRVSNEYQPADQSKDYLLELEGNLTVLVFNRRQLSVILAASGGIPATAGPASLDPEQKPKFKFSGNIADPEKTETVNFSLEGPTRFIFEVDTDSLKQALSGKAKREVNQVFAQFPSISKAEVILFPPWVKTLPTQIKKIEVILKAGD